MWKEEATSESIDNGRMNSAEKIVLSNPINVLKATAGFRNKSSILNLVQHMRGSGMYISSVR